MSLQIKTTNYKLKKYPICNFSSVYSSSVSVISTEVLSEFFSGISSKMSSGILQEFLSKILQRVSKFFKMLHLEMKRHDSKEIQSRIRNLCRGIPEVVPEDIL